MKATNRFLGIFLIACLTLADCLSTSAQVQALENRLYMPGIVAWRSNTSYLSVNMDNIEDVTAVQFNVGIPKVMSVGNDAFRLSERASDHIIQASRTSSDNDFNWYLVLVYSPTNAPFSGRTGRLLDIRFTMGNNVTEGTVLGVPMSDAVMSRSDKTNVLRRTTDGTVTVEFGPDLVITSVAANGSRVSPDSLLEISWSVSNIGQETCTAGWSEEICLTEADATGENYRNHNVRYLATVQCEDTLAGNAAISRNATVRLPSLTGIEGNCRILVRIVPFPESNERPENRNNNATVSSNTVFITKRLSLELGSPVVDESSSGNVFATINRSGRWDMERTFDISSTGDSRVGVPQTVTLGPGQSATRFRITVQDNGILDEAGVVSTIVVTDHSTDQPYEPVSAVLTVIDDEKPALTLSADRTGITEGDSISLAITAERAPERDLTLHLSCDMSQRFDFPSELVLAQGCSNMEVTVRSIDDETLSADEAATFTLWASDYLTAVTTFVLADNDVPDLSLTIMPDTVSESSGIMSLNVSVSRTSNIDKTVTVKLSDDSDNGDIYYGEYSSFTMNAGETKKNFTLGIVDNFLADGSRNVRITASVYFKSCGCSPGDGSIGVAGKTIHILDNDGPSLTVTSNRSILAEGTSNAAEITVSRNTPTTEPLEVTLSSDFDEGLEFSRQAVIPAGEKSVKIPVSVLKNMQENDSRTVCITATSAGHNKGICYVMVSDRTMADAVVDGFELLAADGSPIPDGRIRIKSPVLARVTVRNIGVTDLPAGMDINIYSSAKTGCEYSIITTKPVAAGETAVYECTFKLPSTLGSFHAFAKVNENGTARELLTGNNTSVTASLQTIPPFIAAIESGNCILQYGDSTVIHGTVRYPDGTAWTEGGTEVQIYFMTGGARLSNNIMSDENGHFTYVWYPERSQIGHFGIGACYPGEDLSEEQISADIYGMKFEGVADNHVYTVLEQPYNGIIAIHNPGREPLTGLKVEITDNPDSSTVTVESPDLIEGGQTAYVNYAVTGHSVPEKDEWQTLKFRMTVSQGCVLEKTLYYYTRNPIAQLSCSINRIASTMTKGSTRDYSFDISNIGLGSTGEITLSLPSWMQTVTPGQMVPLAHGDTAQVILRFVPTDDMDLNVPITGQIGVNCKNGNGLAIPFSIEPVSESNGILIVDVCDEYTYYTEEAPHVAGAAISLLHPVSGAALAQGQTDSTGLFAMILPEGYYRLNVSQENHSSYSNIILVDPGTTVRKTVNLSYDAIQIGWKVVETSVKDTYEIETTVRYETQVPTPVVVVDMPESIPARELESGESLIFYATITNKGLIAARDVEFSMPEGLKVLQFEALDYADEPFDLAPGQSVVIPVRVTNGIPGGQAQRAAARSTTPLDEESCYANTFLGYFWECGNDRKYHKYPTGLRLGTCERKETGTSGTSGTATDNDYFFGIKYWLTDGKSTPNRPDTSNSQKLFDAFARENRDKPEATVEPYECEPCKNKVLIGLARQIPAINVLADVAEEARDISNCVTAFKLESGLHDKLGNCKYSKGIVSRYDRIVNDFNNMADHAEEMFFDIELGKMYFSDIVQNTKNNHLFSEQNLESLGKILDCMSDLKYNADGMIDDFDAFVNSTSSALSQAAAKIEGLMETGSKIIDQATEDAYNYNRLNDRIFFPNSWQDNRLDRIASGEYAKYQQDLLDARMDELMTYLDTDIATKENYNAMLEQAKKSLVNGKITKNDIQNLSRNGTRILSDLYYNSRDFETWSKESANPITYERMNAFGVDLGLLDDSDYELLTRGSAKSVPNQHLYKLNALGATQKIADWAGKLSGLLYDTFGECEYEGTEPEAAPSRAISINGNGISVHYNTIPYSYMVLYNNVCLLSDVLQMDHDMNLEYYGDEAWLDLTPYQLQPVSWAIEKIVEQGTDFIESPNIGLYCPENISEQMLKRFLYRWSNTYLGNVRTAQGVPTRSEFEDAIDVDLIDWYGNKIEADIRSVGASLDRTVSDIISENINTAVEDLTGGRSVCASISLKFEQTMVMTRQAFRGTLNVTNGNGNEAMRDVVLQLEVRNAQDGSIATEREMQVNLESMTGFEGNLNMTDGWSLAPNSEGEASILFIPSRYAAPIQAQAYSFGGRLKYLDPFTNTVVTRELNPVTLTVNPSPELNLTYFMQRDVMGDNPLTQDVVEPSEEAEFSLLIHNIGKGDATDVILETAQPEIVDNAKGLNIGFELVSSKLDGGPAMLSLGKSIVSDFGTIHSGKSRYAQWMLRSSLLGHFTDYKVTASHLTSYGNPDLSLLNEVSIHELVRSIGTGNGNTGFLVNDIIDNDRLPDMLYFTDGSTDQVSQVSGIGLSRKSEREYEINVIPKSAGWNYGYFNDPTYGTAKLESAIRVRDGKVCDIRNFWQTGIILRDGKDPIYENRVHFAELFEDAVAERYVLTFSPVPSVWLEIESFGGLSEDCPILASRPDYIDVTFNKEISAGSFTTDNLSYSVQGVKVSTSDIFISQTGDRTYRLDLSETNKRTGNGYHILTVQTAGIEDTEGFNGKDGKNIDWIYFENSMAAISYTVNPADAGSVWAFNADSTLIYDGKAPFGSEIILSAEPAEGYSFTNWTSGGTVLSQKSSFTYRLETDAAIHANFTRTRHLVTVTQSENGKVSALSGYYCNGDTLQLIATPYSSFGLDYWVVNGERIRTGMEIMLLVNQPISVSAVFKKEYYTQNIKLEKGWNWISTFIEEPLPVTELNCGITNVMAQNQDVQISGHNYSGNLDLLNPMELYKVKTDFNTYITHSGHRTEEVSAGIKSDNWIWLGYPWNEPAWLSEVVANPSEGDLIVSQTGFAQYYDGCWEGSLSVLEPGSGYLYMTTSQKTVLYESPDRLTGISDYEKYAEDDTVDIHAYPYVMNIIAELGGSDILLPSDNYVVYAMSGAEYRGRSQKVGNNFYISVYGKPSDEISFIIKDITTGKLFVSNETVQFIDGVLGSRHSRFTISSGNISRVDSQSLHDDCPVYGTDGIMIGHGNNPLTTSPSGIVIINNRKYLKDR